MTESRYYYNYCFEVIGTLHVIALKDGTNYQHEYCTEE